MTEEAFGKDQKTMTYRTYLKYQLFKKQLIATATSVPSTIL